MKLWISAGPPKILHLLMVGLGNIALVEGGARGEKIALVDGGGECIAFTVGVFGVKILRLLKMEVKILQLLKIFYKK